MVQFTARWVWGDGHKWGRILFILFLKHLLELFCFSVLLFRCHDCSEIREHPKYFDLNFLTWRHVNHAFDDRRCVCVCLNNFAPFSKSQIIMSRVGGCFFFFFPNGCKSPAHVIKDADINILVCKLIPSAQLWGRGSVTEVRLRQCAVCAGSPERLICCCTLCKLWQLDCFHGWAEVAVFLLLRSIYWLPRKVQSGP